MFINILNIIIFLKAIARDTEMHLRPHMRPLILLYIVLKKK